MFRQDFQNICMTEYFYIMCGGLEKLEIYKKTEILIAVLKYNLLQEYNKWFAVSV